MNCVREAEKYLWHYRDLKKCLSNGKKQIDILISASAPKGIGGSNLGGEIYRKGNAGTLNDLYQLARWRQIVDETKGELNRLDEIFAELEEMFVVNGSVIMICEADGAERPLTYREFLCLWYVERCRKDKIAERLNYSERSLYRLRDQAIQKFAIQLFGLAALRAV